MANQGAGNNQIFPVIISGGSNQTRHHYELVWRAEIQYREAVKLIAVIALAFTLAGLPVWGAPAAAAPQDDEKEDTYSIIRGLVAEVTKSEKVIRLNLGAKAPGHRFAAVIYPEEFQAFSNVGQWEGKMVEIKGEVADYGGRPQILLKSNQQLRMLSLAKARTAPPEAPKTTGEKAVIRGQLAEILKSDQVIRVNLGAKYPDRRATAVIYPEHFEKFPELYKLVGKAVEITGERLDMAECPHVWLKEASQITLIQSQSTPDEEPQTTGKQGTARGLVAEVLKSDRVIRINLGGKAPYQHGAAVIFPRKFEAFPEIDRMEGRTVEISGAVANYGGREQIILESTNQIVWLDKGKKANR